MSALVPKQGDFLVCIAHLVIWTREQGWLLTGGELWRSDEQAIINSLGEAGRARVAGAVRYFAPMLAVALENNGKAFGIVGSLHGMRLGFDGVLFTHHGGDWDLAPVAMYAPLGDYWKSLDGRAKWGGDFTRADPGHFSFEHEGRA
jgi:hypothetical protein